MFATDRANLRDVFFRAWHGYRENRPLEGIESVIVDVALRHPEYHHVLDAADDSVPRDYHAALGETNPFMHMGLHIAIAEQLSIDQPPGVRGCYRQLTARLPDAHAAEHALMECLTESLWQSQQSGRPPDQIAYLQCLERLSRRP
jgi:hypothetical protein